MEPTALSATVIADLHQAGTAVPESGSAFAMLGLVLIGLGVARRRMIQELA